MIKKPRRFDIYLTTPNPDAGEQAAFRDGHQCLVLSPDEVNTDSGVDTVSVAPIADTGVGYPTRVKVRINGKDGMVFMDYMRPIAKVCLVKRIGKISKNDSQLVALALRESMGL